MAFLEGDLSGTRGFGPRTGLGKTQPGDGEISGNIIEVWLLEPVSTTHNKSAGGTRPTATVEGCLGVKGTAALCSSPEMKPNDALLRPLLAYADGWQKYAQQLRQYTVLRHVLRIPTAVLQPKGLRLDLCPRNGFAIAREPALCRCAPPGHPARRSRRDSLVLGSVAVQ